MIVVAEMLLVALLVSLLMGGSLSTLSQSRLLGESALLGLLLTQVVWPVIVERMNISCPTAVSVWLAMMGGLVVILLMNVRRDWILGLAALGIAGNIIVILANGAMPVSIRAVSEIGSTREDARTVLADDCLHEELGERTSLPSLADWIAIPGPSWQRSVVSPGDLLLGLGLAGWVFKSSRSRSPTETTV